MDNGVLRPNRARGRFFFDRAGAGCITMVQMNRTVGRDEKPASVDGMWRTPALHPLAGATRWGSESQVDGEGLKDTHKGVRGDDDVGERAKESPIG